ncbi:MAG: hypothetical protein AAGC67_22540, partial [Myxococcota bacterium]
HRVRGVIVGPVRERVVGGRPDHVHGVGERVDEIVVRERGRAAVQRLARAAAVVGAEHREDLADERLVAVGALFQERAAVVLRQLTGCEEELAEEIVAL